MLLLHHLIIIHLFHFSMWAMTNSSKHILIHHLTYLVIRTATSTTIIHLIWKSGMLPLAILCLVSHFLCLIRNDLSSTERKLISLNRWMFSLNLPLHLLDSFSLIIESRTSFSNMNFLWASLFLSLLSLYHMLTSILVPLLHLNSMLLLLTGQYWLYLIHFVLTISMINHVLMLCHHVWCWSIVGLKQMHLGATSIVS